MNPPDPSANPLLAFFIILGLLFLAIGALTGIITGLASKNIPLGKLPGDIVIDRGNVKIYFPLMTSIVLSVTITLVIWLLSRIR